MSYTVKQLLDIAHTEVGYLEKKTNSQLDSKAVNAGYNNYTKYARDLHKAGYYQASKQGYAWCDMFVDWCHWIAAGKDAKEAQRMICQTGPYGAGCTESAQYYKNKNRLFQDPKPGDQIFFWDSKKTHIAHTGIVTKVDDTYVYTIEGNTSSKSGVVANGGAVEEKKYKLNYNRIYRYGRPYYDEEDKNEAEELVVDGKWGKATTTRLQQIFGTTVDGKISNQWLKYKLSNPGLTSGWDWKLKPNKRGSALIMAMQKWAGMPVNERDGEIGPKTIKAFQKKLGTTQDGKVSKPSQMVKALQAWANKQ
jgi:hypothetical protein